MFRLLQLLEHPNGVAIAKRMLNSSTAESKPCQLQHHSSSSLCASCAGHSELFQAYCVCHELHWNCILLRLSTSAFRTTPDRRMEEVLEFGMLSVTAQNNLLVLLQTEKHKITSHVMRSFLDTIANYFGDDQWSMFLLQRLKMPETLLVAQDLDADASVVSTSAVFTALSVNMLEQAEAMGNKFEANTQRKMPEDMEKVMLKKVAQFPSFTTGTVFESVIQRMEADGESKRSRLDVSSTVQPPHEVVISYGDSEWQKTMQDQTVMQEDIFSVAPAENPISQEVLRVVHQIKERWCSGHTISSEDFIYLMSLSRKKIEKVLQLAEINFSEVTVIAVVQNLISSAPDFSYHGLTILLETIILQMLLDLQQCASRPLLSAVSSLVVKYPTAAIVELLLPFIQSKKFGPAHADLLSTVVKDVMTSEQRDLFWRNFILSTRESEREAFVWNEDVLTVIKVLLEKKVQLNCEVVVPLVEMLQKNSSSFRACPKFGKLLIQLVNSFHDKLKPGGAALMEIASTHRSIVKIALIKSVKKL